MLDRNIAEVKEALKADEIIVALTDEVNWRKEVMPTYKGHRRDRKPIIYRALRSYVDEKYRSYKRPKLEGDDILGILMTHPKIVPGDKIMVSIDKDMKTVPGNLVNWNDPTREIQVITEDQANYWHLYQTLTGDTADGYPGCPGIGPKSAEKILAKDPGWNSVVAAYAKAGLSEEVALMNARVARICRASDYNFKEMAVRLWAPQN